MRAAADAGEPDLGGGIKYQRGTAPEVDSKGLGAGDVRHTSAEGLANFGAIEEHGGEVSPEKYEHRKEGEGMRRLTLLFFWVGELLILTAGTALTDTYVTTGSSDDVLRGTSGPATLRAGSGNDALYGSVRADRINGEAGKDELYAGAGRDIIFGGYGGDTIYAKDGYADIVDCGGGYDWVQRDVFDLVAGCEGRF